MASGMMRKIILQGYSYANKSGGERQCVLRRFVFEMLIFSIYRAYLLLKITARKGGV